MKLSAMMTYIKNFSTKIILPRDIIIYIIQIVQQTLKLNNMLSFLVLLHCYSQLNGYRDIYNNRDISVDDYHSTKF